MAAPLCRPAVLPSDASQSTHRGSSSLPAAAGRGSAAEAAPPAAVAQESATRSISSFPPVKRTQRDLAD